MALQFEGCEDQHVVLAWLVCPAWHGAGSFIYLHLMGAQICVWLNPF